MEGLGKLQQRRAFGTTKGFSVLFHFLFVLLPYTHIFHSYHYAILRESSLLTLSNGLMAAIILEDYSWIDPTYLSHQFDFVREKEMSFDPLEIGVSFN